jgi:energy-coupling factor transporter ATP-binding protein EcfA2
MRVMSFRVQDFRSVNDSGWVELDHVTGLIGTNESGKTNLLLPLWKLNPATGGEIDPIGDYPRSKYNKIKLEKEKPIFISVRFELEDSLAQEIATLCNCPGEHVKHALVERDYAGERFISFPSAHPVRHVPKANAIALLDAATKEIEGATCTKTEDVKKAEIVAALNACGQALQGMEDSLHRDEFEKFVKTIPEADAEAASKRSVIGPRLNLLHEQIAELLAGVSNAHPDDVDEARALVMKHLPHFVYYSNYGNLDSEIYLPHVIQNLTRKGLGSKETAKARTLKVLFDFVRLSPKEIQELGEDEVANPNGRMTEDEIAESAKKRKERDVLLQSAGAELTKRFREWWKQGDYRFRFQADGDHFRIWVSDDRRPDDIELENRSTGLQWFLSFFLIFLVESLDAHKNSILLLDEPGLSLHPLAQEDLSRFFEGLSGTNQLLYTTHSPFLVDADHLERIKVVYVADDGATMVSADLRAADSKSSESKSIYPVYAALGLSASRTLLLGCKTIIVEGTSDQYYLSAIKTILIANGELKPAKEIIFMPAWGVKGVKAIISILTGKDEQLPNVLLDSDTAGTEFQASLLKSIYKDAKERIVMLGAFASVTGAAEIEDLFPQALLAKLIDRTFRSATDKDFSDEVKAGQPIVPQIEAFAAKHSITLSGGWKVDLAKQVKQRLLKDGMQDQTLRQMWAKLFEAMAAESD